jgi:hypothetical protein
MKNERIYQQLTIDDPYYGLFNFNYSTRNSCHECKYANLHRQSDITLSDFWSFYPNSFKTINYDDGISCVIINSPVGADYFSKIKKSLVFEQSSIDAAVFGNQCLKKPFAEPNDSDEFWKDFCDGDSTMDLFHKYVKKPYAMPKHVFIENLKVKYRWLYRKVIKR